MNSELVSVLLWSLLTILAILLAVFFGYMYRKDSDARKLTFMTAFAFASFTFLPKMQTGWENIPIMERLYSWSSLPILSAVLIAVLTSLLNIEDFTKPFKVFLLTVVAALFMIAVPLPLKFLRSSLFQGISITVIVALIYLIVKRREISDFMFLLSMVCFISGGLGMARDLGVEFNVFAYAFAYVFLTLVFITSKENVEGSIASFFALKRKLRKTQEELRISQEQLMKAERLAAIGELAAMVGHDLRNPLTGIAGATYYLKKKLALKTDEKTKEMLELIEKDIEYSNKIINDLVEYSNEMQLKLEKTTLKSVINEVLSLVTIPENIMISDLTENEQEVEIDVEKIKRVIVNIVKNAIDAMPKGGKLIIRSSKTNGSVEISFTDTGTGIPKDVLEKVWTPLFTTKAKGMGFGLAICKRFVEAHGGSVSVESMVDKGTTFTVTIPEKQKVEGGEKEWLSAPESLLLTTTKP